MKKHLKRIFGFIFVFLLVLFSCINVIPLKADVEVNQDGLSIEYDEYNYLIYISDSTSSSCTAFILGDVDNTTISFYGGTLTDPFYIDNVGNNFDIGVYLVNGSIVEYDDPYYYAELVISQAVLYDSFVNTVVSGQTINSYNKGYQEGLLQNQDEVYRQAYSEGQNSVNDPSNPLYQEIFEKGQEYEDQYYEEGHQGYQMIYSIGYQDALDLIGDEDNPTFMIMFKTIINYIRDFFVVGLNVEIFGINIGNFCLGIFMLSIFMMVLNIFRR